MQGKTLAFIGHIVGISLAFIFTVIMLIVAGRWMNFGTILALLLLLGQSALNIVYFATAKPGDTKALLHTIAAGCGFLTAIVLAASALRWPGVFWMYFIFSFLGHSVFIVQYVLDVVKVQLPAKIPFGLIGICGVLTGWLGMFITGCEIWGGTLIWLYAFAMLVANGLSVLYYVKAKKL